MQIEPVAKQYKEISKANFLQIPPFQRPYSWTPDNIEEFWSDLINAQGEEYFLGSVVFYRDKKDKTTLNITDGQQRLTTINIVLCALRDICDQLDLADLAAGTHGFIENIDEDNKKRFTIKYSGSNTYFASGILDRNANTQKPVTDEEKNQQAAYDYFRKKIEAYLATLAGDNWKSETTTAKHIKTIRDSIINMRFVVLTLENEDEAFVIFETLNTRGKDLEVSDLVKNHFAKFIKDQNKDIDTVSGHWNMIRGEFENASTQIDFDTFLVHYWLAHEKYVSKKKLFKEFKRAVPKTKALDRLKDISSAASTYAAVAVPGSDKWNKPEQIAIRRSLRAINVFSVAQARPLLLAICRKYLDSKTISLKSAAKAVSLIENFTFQFNAITQSRGGGGIAGMYASLAQNVTKTESSQEFADCVQEVRRRFHERELSQEEFDLGWDQLRFHRKHTRDRQLIRYILQKFRSHYSPSSADNFEEFTIEHIVSQSRADNLERLDLIGKIGNLIFVPEKVNQKLGTKSASTKLKVLETSGFSDDILSEFTDFTLNDIDDRTPSMASIAFDDIWKY